MAEKTKVIAKTVIHRTLEPGKAGDRQKGIRPTKPKVQIIKAGTVFMTKNKDEYDALLEAGAIRNPDKGEKVSVDIENVAAGDETPSKGKRANPDNGGGDKPIDKMTGDELDAYLEASDHTKPEGWDALKVADKKAWLTEADAVPENDLV